MSNRTFLFFTANDNKYHAFVAKFTLELEKTFGNGIVCFYGLFGTYKVWHHHLSEQGTGSLQIIEDVIGYIKPDAIILVGITCGNKRLEQKIGDVLFSEMIIDHIRNKEFDVYDNEPISYEMDNFFTVCACRHKQRLSNVGGL